MVVEVILLVSMVSLLLLSALSDPGVLPRAHLLSAAPTFHPIQPEEGGEGEDPATTLRVRSATVSGQSVRVTWCETCQIWKPPRAHHCRDCDACIAQFDHHCPWIGNCVGQRNYRYFVLFLWAVVLGCLYTGGVSGYDVARILHLANTTSPTPSSSSSAPGQVLSVMLSDAPIPLLLILYSVVVLLSILFLCGFHCYLIARGQTTYESLKGDTQAWLLTRNQSAWGNFFRLLFVSRPPPYLDLTAHVPAPSGGGGDEVQPLIDA